MIPLHDENPTEIRAIFTATFIVLNVVAWFMLQGAGAEAPLAASVGVFGARPCEMTGACATEGLGWSALFTSMFMHGSWEHILGNMLFLWVFGNNVEDSMGHFRFIAFYLICGIVAGLAHVLLSPTSVLPAVGASGAISGIMGGYVLLYPKARVKTWIPPIFLVNLNAFVVLGWWFFLQLAGGLMSFGPENGEQGGVAVWAHVGGFVAGVVLIKMFEKPRLTYAKRHKPRLPREEIERLQW